MELELQDILKAVDGECLNSLRLHNGIVQSITIDSRQIDKQSLFIPLKGERFDGHQFINKVFDQGAIAVLTEERSIEDDRLCTIYVRDTKKALLDLAQYYRSLFKIPVIGITGSVGKTSTKEIIAAVLSAKFKVHKTEGNYNNEIGLPLTLFKLEKHHEVAVVELGMNHFGEIHKLSLAATPQIAVITNIGTSHIEYLGSRAGILQAKLEILDGLDTNGVLIINGDNDLLGQMNQISFETLKYGLSPQYPYYAKNIVGGKQSTTADIVTPQHHYNLSVEGLGEHMVYNTLAAIAIAEHLGLTKTEVLAGIETYRPTKMRMHIQVYDNGITVMDDTYNASTDSMYAALKVLQSYPDANRKIAVLGDMFEMGEHAKNLHEEVGRFACQVQIDVLCAVGELAKHIYEGARQMTSCTKILYYATKEAFLQDMKNILHSGDTVLFKASRGMHFEQMVEEAGKVNGDEQ
ncbi:MAG: UDP-N-acetylmuramoylalanyl-D-glutamyl-2,6-diaminopimelate/D-alanyl-D-alanyl ligase [Clostridia bacterium]|jgi:UDP-N-acetylmuramoyl-tripeptide--D-alanyl-D-alanine ligase|nr:UDP-N-acetylmuramoylalanyl-D-glutamyl-2,6-diaminopimelate/D-alanyl-D-alanyl ligase [Clostridia bacterium]